MSSEQLKLKNQLCFPIYAVSRLITRSYQPYLDKVGITYPQYLVLLVLWETDGITVNEISKKLLLNTNTITPLLQRMERQGLLERKRSEVDERKVLVRLTKKGQGLHEDALCIPLELGNHLASNSLSLEDLIDLRDKLYKMMDLLGEEKSQTL
jgi:DNA-binding MarR family transcriptional regulator